MKQIEKFPFKHFTFNSDHFFKSLTDKEIELLDSSAKTRLYKRRQVVFYEDSPCTGVYYIRDGLVRKYKTGTDQKEHTFYISKTGDLIGYHALLSDEFYFDSAEAMRDSVISFIPKEVFLELLNQSPSLFKIVLQSISHEFGVMVNNWTIRSELNTTERLALNLLLLNDKFNDFSGDPIEIRISRADLASLVGCSLENLVRLLSDFRNENIIEIKGKVIFLQNIKKLIHLSKIPV